MSPGLATDMSSGAGDRDVTKELERFSKEISGKREKLLVLLQVNGNKVVIAPSRSRA